VAATPKKGSSYVGELKQTAARVGKRVVLKVSDKGIGRVRLECGGKAKLYLPATCDGKGGKDTLQLAE
jgi:hypothetical protein